MANPTMFQTKVKKLKPRNVFIIKNLETGDRFISNFTPEHYEEKDSAIYTIEFMQIPEYSVVEVEYDPETKTYSS